MNTNYNDDKTGYQEDFLGNNIVVPLPHVSIEHQDDILEMDNLRDGFIADYCHYSLVMSKSKKQAFFSAANVNQNEFQKSISNRKWFLDSRIGIDFQLGADVYNHNEWDRGHLTRRADVTWGEPYVVNPEKVKSQIN